MSFYILLLLIFSAIFQPGVIWVGLESFRPFFVLAILTIVSTVIYTLNHRTPGRMPVEYKLMLGFAAIETLSVVQYMWVSEIIVVALNWVKIVIIYFTISLNIDSFVKIKKMLWICVTAIGIVCIVSFYRYLYPEIPPLEFRDYETPAEFAFRAQTYVTRLGELTRLAGYGMYSGANDFALMITICFPLAYKLFEIDRNFIKRLFLIFLIPFMFYLVVLTVSRGGVLGTSLVTALSILTVRKIKVIAGSQVFKVVFVGAIIIGVLTVMATKLSERSDAASMVGGDDSAGNRVLAWKAGAKMLLRNPHIGVGYNHFPRKVGEYGGPRGIQAHNTIVKVAAESGLIGIFCYLGLLYMAFKKLRMLIRYYSKKGEDDKVLLSQAILFGLVGFFFNTQFSVKEHEWLLYILLGMATSAYRIYQREIAQEKAKQAAIV